MNPFQIEVQESADAHEIIIVSFSGDMGPSTITEIRRTFDDILQKNRFFVVVDMSNVLTVSSAAIGELMGCRTSLIDRNGDLVLAGMKMDVFETVHGLDADKIFKFYKDVRSAINLYYWEYQGQVETVTVSFPSELSFVPPVRQMVQRIAKQKNYSNKDAFRIETIVDEICNNAVEHGDRTDGSEVEVTVAIDRKKIAISITNTSDVKKVDKLKKMSEYLSQPKASVEDIRGRGLALVKMLSNDFQIKNSDFGTCVHVTKFRED